MLAKINDVVVYPVKQGVLICHMDKQISALANMRHKKNKSYLDVVINFA